MFIFPIGDENPTGRKPYVNYILIAINIIVFILFFYRQDYKQIIMEYGFVPAKAIPVTYITSQFLHGGFGHLIGNMLYLYIVGDNVEDKLGHIGYLVFYLVCGAAADFAHARMIPESMLNIPTIGASGAISAVLGAYLCLFPKNKIIFFYFFWIFFIIRYGTFKVQSFWAIGLWFVLQFFSHITSGSMSNVAYGAHIGGFIGGALIMAILVLLGVVTAHWHKERDLMDLEDRRVDKYLDQHSIIDDSRNMKPYVPPNFRKPYQPPVFRPPENLNRRDDDYW